MKFTSALVALSSAFLASTVSAQTVVDIAVGSPDHTTLVDLVTQAGLVETLSGDGPFTVFAPTNDAFTALDGAADIYTTPEWSQHLVDILTYHVTAGKVMSTDLTLNQMVGMINGGDTEITSLTPPMINTANINPADLNATNGVVHVTDAVLLPTSVTSNIVDIASGNDDFSTLVELVAAAGLVETLQGPGPFTVFAPTNEAFNALPTETVDFLKTPEGKEQLTDILTYHVYAGNAYESELVDGPIEMVNGDEATVKTSPVMINDATVGPANILASNGVIHVIDKVIMPPTDDTAAPGAPTAAPAPTASPGSDDEVPSAAVSMGSVLALVSAAVVMLF